MLPIPVSSRQGINILALRPEVHLGVPIDIPLARLVPAAEAGLCPIP